MRSHRGFKRDEEATIAARFGDYRSFISQPKVIEGECSEPKAHLVLFGFEDKAKVRAEIFRRNREENGGVNRCFNCGRRVYENPEFAEEYGLLKGDWDHIRNKAGERCDCPENGRVSCSVVCHRSRHPQPRWSTQEQVTP